MPDDPITMNVNPVAKSGKIITKPIGETGLNEYAATLERTVEYIIELQGREGSQKYRQMSKSDGLIGMILRSYKAPIGCCEWGISLPDDATDEEKKAVDILNSKLFADSGIAFQKLLFKILSCIEYGYSLFELYWTSYDFEGGTWLTPVLEQRVQTSIQNIWPDKQIVRQITFLKGVVEIPFENLVFFVLNEQGEDLRGESILRCAYNAWKKKRAYEEWMAIGIQRSTGGIPSMTVPKGTRVDSEDYIAAELLLKNITFHEDAYMILPDGWTFELFESKFNPDYVQKAIDATNSEMALSVLTQFLLLGSVRSTGSFALSNDQSGFFLDGLQYICTLIEGVVNENVLKPFFQYNFGDAVTTDRINLKGLGLNKKAAEALATMLQQLGTAGFLKPTLDDEITLRKKYDLPPLSDDELARREKQQEAADKLAANPPPTVVDPEQDPGGQQPKKFAEPTKAEHTARQEHIEKSITEVQDFMQANLMLMKDKLCADVESTLKRGQVEIQGLKQIQVSSTRYEKGLGMKLAGIALESWNMAKATAKNASVKFAEDKDPKEVSDKTLKQYVLNQASVTADNQAQNMLTYAVSVASSGSLKGLSIAQTTANVAKALQALIESGSIAVAGSLLAVGTSNFGAMQFYQEIKDQLWGYTFMNDDPVSEICKWYDGKTFSVNSPELATATPPLHPNCKSYMAPIYKLDGAASPEIDDVIAPPTILKQKTVY